MKLKDFYELAPLSQLGDAKVIDFAKIPKQDFIINIDGDTPLRDPKSTTGYFIHKGDVLMSYPPNGTLRALYVASHAGDFVAIAGKVWILRRRREAPEGMPAYLLPYFLSISFVGDSKYYDVGELIANVMRLPVPDKTPKENETILGALVKNHEIMVLRRKQAELQYQLQSGLCQMLMKNKRNINDPDEPEQEG